jgi:hypothetical protein
MLVELAFKEMLSSPLSMVKFLNVIRSENNVSTPSVFSVGSYTRINVRIAVVYLAEDCFYRIKACTVDINVLKNSVFRAINSHSPELRLNKA